MLKLNDDNIYNSRLHDKDIYIDIDIYVLIFICVYIY